MTKAPFAGLVLLSLAVLVLAVPDAPAAAQCAMCKTALTGSAEGRAMTASFNRGILLMLAAPYLVMGVFVLGVYRGRLVRRAARFAASLRARRTLRDPA
jgi:hypothetical protein